MNKVNGWRRIWCLCVAVVGKNNSKDFSGCVVVVVMVMAIVATTVTAVDTRCMSCGKWKRLSKISWENFQLLCGLLQRTQAHTQFWVNIRRLHRFNFVCLHVLASAAQSSIHTNRFTCLEIPNYLCTAKQLTAQHKTLLTENCMLYFFLFLFPFVKKENVWQVKFHWA